MTNGKHGAVAFRLSFLALVIFSVHAALAQVTVNVMLRVLLIRTAAVEGTAFTVEVDDKQYLITAKHVVAGLKENDKITIRINEKWEDIDVKVFRCEDPIDIAVLVPPRQLTVTFPLSPDAKGMRLYQDIYFAGFPYELYTNAPGLSHSYPLPFMKKGIVSAHQKQNDAVVFFLDGNNNPGFSGGPVVFKDLDKNDWTFHVFAVVSGYRHDFSRVQRMTEINREDIKPDEIAKGLIQLYGNKLYRLSDVDEGVRTNTGIIVAYGISPAIELIRKHPIGAVVSDSFKP